MTSYSGKNISGSSEITSELVNMTPIAHFRGIDVYCFSGEDCPATLREIGYLREEGFKAYGGGRGVDCDLDEWDHGESAYYQLIAWDPDEKKLVASYRYQPGKQGIDNEEHYLRTANLFDYSETFRKTMLPNAIELGRSVVSPSAKRGQFGFFAIWKGLGALLRLHPEVQYFFGTVSLHTTMSPDAANALISYLIQHYPPPEPLLKAKKEIAFQPDREKTDISEPAAPDEQDIPENRIRKLSGLMKEFGDFMPPILKSYMGLSNDIWFGDPVIDHDFSDAVIIATIVPIKNINPKFRKLFLE